jgi:hypothetical protein
MASVQRRIAPAPLTSPLPRPQRGSGRGARGMLRAALTPSPSPALRERGELVYGLGAAQNRPCSAHFPPSSPTAWERKGARGMVRAALTPDPSPALRERGGSWFMASVALTGAESPLQRSSSPFLAHSVGAEGG